MRILFNATIAIILLLFTVAFIVPAQRQTDYVPLIKSNVFDKLVGTWKNSNGKDFERWIRMKDGTYNSVAFRVKGVDTSLTENAFIYPSGKRWIFR